MDFCLKCVSRSLSHSVCAFRAYGLKISTTDESVYQYISVYTSTHFLILTQYFEVKLIVNSKIKNCELKNKKVKKITVSTVT